MLGPRTIACLALSFAATASGCSSSSSDAAAGASPGFGDPAGWSVTADGPFTCGHRQLSMTYTPKGGLPSRTIPVHVWYPSTDTSGDRPHYRGIFVDEHAWENASLAAPAFAAGFPVLVHSHGYKGFAANSARLMCQFASHGWLTVAPEHVGNTLTDTPDKLPLAVYLERPLDVSAALDFVTKLPAEDPLAGKADLGHLAMSGHSFGTYTAWAIGGAKIDAAAIQTKCASGDVTDCADAQVAALTGGVSDPRPQIVMPLAGGRDDFLAADGLDDAKVPVLLMSGSLDNPTGAQGVYDAVSKVDITWVNVDGGCHQLYGLGNTVYGDPACAGLPDEQGFSLVNPWVLAYARYHVLADRGEEVRGIVEGTAAGSPLVHVSHKSP